MFVIFRRSLELRFQSYGLLPRYIFFFFFKKSIFIVVEPGALPPLRNITLSLERDEINLALLANTR